ncbi:GDSL-type esterase/lipase family protein [Petroclostridium sp. X23]|uniref:GDSL-type esterase/lipase family protein n=1 Tax=Petroclostridium sp. X23 TaxID=3045146 RepID=UPI0024AC882F|nr:GDSL-type esterase/lipase family protein [Petroclostridium sp. X23]WHH58567.1 GDSL-type esterase/lipase family protein [Petroclostridium sp. X23]
MKKLMMCFLIGILLIGTAACGNKTAEKDATAQFKNSVFMGDSITEGFAVNEILPNESVMAGAGATAGYIYEEYIDDLAEKKPDNVFIMLGSDDMLMPVDDPKALFESDLTKLINKIKEEVPNAKIYLQSIAPVTQEALKQEPRYERIEEYNELLKELTGKLSINYVDIGALAKENHNLFAEDGVHFKKEFYQLWLKKLSESL